MSHSHAYFSWKATVEFLRVQPTIAGHSWWLFQDFFGISNGLVDYAFQPKGGALAMARIKNFVHQVVVVLKNGTLWDNERQSAVYVETLTGTCSAGLQYACRHALPVIVDDVPAIDRCGEFECIAGTKLATRWRLSCWYPTITPRRCLGAPSPGRPPLRVLVAAVAPRP